MPGETSVWGRSVPRHPRPEQPRGGTGLTREGTRAFLPEPLGAEGVASGWEGGCGAREATLMKATWGGLEMSTVPRRAERMSPGESKVGIWGTGQPLAEDLWARSFETPLGPRPKNETSPEGQHRKAAGAGPCSRRLVGR